ncbi:HAAS signaling domain-containing protein [Macrococcus lamae]|uniref:DUF1700 domain-containing protein n=1 Tax=Macrococcus lamae TaxID=198484 RepID=A0A4R6BV05_9STAP|nr:DUF1700 domain-containing protein [Macrococcus lamae]TDM12054.1 DUF1700 domain-containing protein [Macrococcus lamae]
MSRKDYLDQLYRNLKGLPEKERESIMFDYESHFEEGLMDGHSEQQIADQLGHPDRVARELKADYSVVRAEQHPTTSNAMQAVMATIGLSVLNIFFVSIPLMIYISLVISAAFAALMFILSPLFLLLDFLFNGVAAVSWFEGFMVIASVGAGILLSIGLFYVIKAVNKLLVNYARWNIRTVKGGE